MSAKGCSPSKRRDMDIMKLMMSDYEVEWLEDCKADFCVKFKGPKDTAYESGVWKIHVELPIDYPYRSPSIGFMNRLYHPNVDELSGSVCLDVINQTWSPMFDLVNIFDVFIPQLLRYPNASDPLNAEAAGLLIGNPEGYTKKVKELVAKYATEEALSANEKKSDAGSSSQEVVDCQNDSEENIPGEMEMDDDDDDLSSLSDGSQGGFDDDFEM